MLDVSTSSFRRLVRRTLAAVTHVISQVISSIICLAFMTFLPVSPPAFSTTVSSCFHRVHAAVRVSMVGVEMGGGGGEWNEHDDGG